MRPGDLMSFSKALFREHTLFHIDTARAVRHRECNLVLVIAEVPPSIAEPRWGKSARPVYVLWRDRFFETDGTWLVPVRA